MLLISYKTDKPNEPNEPNKIGVFAGSLFLKSLTDITILTDFNK